MNTHNSSTSLACLIGLRLGGEVSAEVIRSWVRPIFATRSVKDRVVLKKCVVCLKGDGRVFKRERLHENDEVQ